MPHMNQVHPEELKPGMYVAIYKNVVPVGESDLTEIPEDADMPPGMREALAMIQQQKQYPCDGRALRVDAVELPFVAVTSGSKRGPIDTRRCELIQVSRDYAVAMGAEGNGEISHLPENITVIDGGKVGPGHPLYEFLSKLSGGNGPK